ncbi:MAG: hypothetical protein ACXWLB_00755 [Reyranella sp.]
MTLPEVHDEAQAPHKQARLVTRHVDQPIANVDLFFVSQDQMRVVEVAQADDQRVQPCGINQPLTIRPVSA